MTFISQLEKRRSDWVRANRENSFEEGILNLLTELYPDNAHFIYELLQNAEDAQASRVTFSLSHEGLTCRHNGRIQFSDANVESITSIGKSSKRDDVTQIGKFGVGFKAVFSYTSAPRVYSGQYAFEILDLVCPSEVPKRNDIGLETVFEFPFNKPSKPSDIASEEVRRGLEELSETTLLFLNNIEQISWSSDDGQHVDITRLAISSTQCEIEYLRNGVDRRAKEWLLLKESVKGKPHLHVAIAFALELLDKPAVAVPQDLLGHRYKIQRCNGQVCIYFPADKETSKLRFHLHAPFASTVARDSVRNRPENGALIEQLAALLAHGLHLIRDEGLLTQDFLEVLPQSEDDVSSFYAPLMHAVLKEMTVDALTPTHNKDFAPANSLVQGSAALKELLSDDDLNVVMSREDVVRISWAMNAMQNSRAERFLRSLDIPVLTAEAFVQYVTTNARPQITGYDLDKTTYRLTPTYNNRPGVSAGVLQQAFWQWLDQHDDHWMQRLYSTLNELTPEYGGSLDSMKAAPIVKVGGRRYVSGNSAYFPSAGVEEDTVFPRVTAAVYSSGRSEHQKQAAAAFLARVGVRAVGPKEDIERIIRTRYTGETFPSVQVHLRHMKAFVEFWEDNPRDVEIFRGKSVFLAYGEEYFCSESLVYLDAPFLDTGLAGLYSNPDDEGVPERRGLTHSYLTNKKFTKRLVEFATAVGVQRRIEISETNTTNHPQWRELHVDVLNGAHKRDTGIDVDYVIEDVESMLVPPSIQAARALWLTLVQADSDVLEAMFKANRQQPLRTRPSRLVLALRELEWVPLADGTFVKPAHATAGALASILPFDNSNGWMTALGFGEAEKYETANSKKKEEEVITDGFASLEEYNRIRLAIQQIPIEQRQEALELLTERFTTSSKGRRNFPDRPVRDKDLRTKRVIAEVERTQQKERAVVNRTVVVGYQETKVDAREYLRQQYTDEHGVMLCQICRDELPFKTLDDTYYFEATAVIDSTPKFMGAAYLCLCPNHSAMYLHANPNRGRIVTLLEECDTLTLEIELAGRPVAVEFTETHLIDLQASLKAEFGGQALEMQSSPESK